MKPGAILETALYVTDLDAARAFYSGVLGLDEYSASPPRQIFYTCGNQMLLLFNADETVKPPRDASLPVPPHGAHGPGHVCFRAGPDEIDRWRMRLMDHGIEIEADFTWPGGGRSIYFRDPSGNSLEFAEPALWGLN